MVVLSDVGLGISLGAVLALTGSRLRDFMAVRTRELRHYGIVVFPSYQNCVPIPKESSVELPVG